MEDVAAIKPNTATLAEDGRRQPLATLRVLLVDRRQGSQIALDRARELLRLRRDDPKLRLLLPAGALAARVDPDR